MILSTYYIIKSSHKLILSKYYQIIHVATGNCQFCQVTRPSFTKQTALCSLCSWDDRRQLAPPNDHKKYCLHPCSTIIVGLTVHPCSISIKVIFLFAAAPPFRPAVCYEYQVPGANNEYLPSARIK